MNKSTDSFTSTSNSAKVPMLKSGSPKVLLRRTTISEGSLSPPGRLLGRQLIYGAASPKSSFNLLDHVCSENHHYVNGNNNNGNHHLPQPPTKWISVKPRASVPRSARIPVSSTRTPTSKRREREHSNPRNMINYNNQSSFSELETILPPVGPDEDCNARIPYYPNMLNIGVSPSILAPINHGFPSTTMMTTIGDWKQAVPPNQQIAKPSENHPLISQQSAAAQQQQQQQQNLKKNEKYALVLFDFEADCSDELQLTKDGVIIVCEQTTDGWWRGRHLDDSPSKTGTFPENYVKLLDISDQSIAQLFHCSSTPSAAAADGSGSHLSQLQYTDPEICFSNSISHRNKIVTPYKQQKPDIKVKVYVPPHGEHIMITLGQNATLKDLLAKTGRKRKIWQQLGVSVHFERVNQHQQSLPLPMDTPVLMLGSSRESGIRLFIEGLEYRQERQQQQQQVNNNNKLSSSYSSSLSSSNPRSRSQSLTNSPMMSSSAAVSTSITSSINNQFQGHFNVNIKGQEESSVKQWVTLNSSSIKVFNSPSDKKPLRILGIKFSTVKLQQKMNKYTVIFKTIFQTIYFITESKTLATYFLHSIETSNEYRDNNVLLKKRQQKQLIKSTESLEDALSLDRKQIMMDIRSRYCNRYCADCNGPDPEWSSVSLGCFLCDDCCHIHQNQLGLQMSEIYSVLLDDTCYELSNLTIFQSIGNAVSNQYWEYRLKDKKINSNSTLTEKEEYIKSKYKNKDYIPLDINLLSPIELHHSRIEQDNPTTTTQSK
ncbi:pleckstrin domain-containing protein [Heterostelium album PN500]|uniref:Pleckstrin domain-containing protein n=1 Tax=Heterostelium pallidum (strain ATCC 26659 / Pp 5 / PN500) TaxID=670386 RepID=D3BPC1_HETP5|nr:pleckstrin domain-containing protein [Heterostelium album PN500]EFA77131.1 pleckstrin domain-containing protein [Heterostelium album PN500]|eukprot:XP_020429260.1 pleckstrin domain-containing protein [Heterostelium album PN500]